VEVETAFNACALSNKYGLDNRCIVLSGVATLSVARGRP